MGGSLFRVEIVSGAAIFTEHRPLVFRGANRHKVESRHNGRCINVLGF